MSLVKRSSQRSLKFECTSSSVTCELFSQSWSFLLINNQWVSLLFGRINNPWVSFSSIIINPYDVGVTELSLGFQVSISVESWGLDKNCHLTSAFKSIQIASQLNHDWSVQSTEWIIEWTLQRDWLDCHMKWFHFITSSWSCLIWRNDIWTKGARHLHGNKYIKSVNFQVTLINFQVTLINYPGGSGNHYFPGSLSLAEHLASEL